MILGQNIHQCTGANFVSILFIVILLVILPILLVNEHDVNMTHPPLLLVIARRSFLLFLNDLLLVEMLNLFAIILIMRVDCTTEHTDEVSKKPEKLKCCDNGLSLSQSLCVSCVSHLLFMLRDI